MTRYGHQGGKAIGQETVPGLEPIFTLRDGPELIRRIMWAPAGCTIAAPRSDGTVVIWDAEHGTAVQKIVSGEKTVYSVAWSPDGQTLAVGGDTGDITLWSAIPHTHVRGKRWEVTAVYPDGRTEMILNVPKYDFNWQTDYIFKTPLVLPKGTKLKTSAWYDNSTANKSNPDPTKDVWWGDQTWEEMMFTGITFSVDPLPPVAAGAH